MRKRAKKKPEPILELTKVYQEAASQILKARDRSKVIHKSGNIRASGDEIERPFRELIRRKLPSKYYVGQGHIVDKNLSISPQLDIIVADNSATPILFSSEDGTEFFPYESVYLFGEVKSSYLSAKKYLSSFADTSAAIVNRMVREHTPRNYIGNRIYLGKGLHAEREEPYLNPMFSFLVFADSGDVAIGDLIEPYTLIPDVLLPNLVCFLDGKLIVKASVLKTGAGIALGAMDAQTHHIITRDDIYWILLEFNSEQYKSGHALAVLVLMIMEHLSRCLLLEPPMKSYMDNILATASHNGPIVFDPRFFAELFEEPGADEVPKVKEYLARRKAKKELPTPPSSK